MEDSNLQRGNEIKSRLKEIDNALDKIIRLFETENRSLNRAKATDKFTLALNDNTWEARIEFTVAELKVIYRNKKYSLLEERDDLTNEFKNL